VIQFNNVSKIYNGVSVIKDFTAHIDKGEFVFISGPSGSGKSTLLKFLFCSERPDSGQVLFQEEDLSSVRRARIPFIRRTIGFVFQDPMLLSSKSVFENIAIALRVVGFPGKEIGYRVTETLKLIGMSDKINVVPSTLSGGEQQKVAIARAIVNDPLVLAADEPAGNLDRDSAWEVFRIFEKINQTGTTVVIATHNDEIVQRMHKRVISLKEAVRDDTI